jgi:Fe-S cluster biogenesis protein NfuA
MDISKKIEEVLEKKVDPILAQHFGGASLSKYEDGIAYIKMEGHCAGCPSAKATLESIVKEQLLNEIPEIKDVKLDDTISEDLLNQAKSILNRK